MKNKGYAKFGGTNKVHYGKCGSGVYKTVCGQLKPRVGACGFVRLCLCYLVE